MRMNIWKIMYLICEETCEAMIYHRSYTHNLIGSCEIKAWKKLSPERDSNYLSCV